MRLPVLVFVCLWVTAPGAPAWAQPARSVGVTMGYPTGVGVLWHISDRISLRPDVSLTRSRATTTTTSVLPPSLFGPGETFAATTTQTDWTTSAGLSALVTIRDLDRLRLYVVPRVAWFRTDTENDAQATSLGALNSENDGLQASGGLGAHYGLGDRAAVFGELGVYYTRQKLSSGYSGGATKATLTGVGLRSVVGFVLYF